MARTQLSSRSLGISDDRNLELSFYSGIIQLEIEREYGDYISRAHIVRAVLASPYLETEIERAWVIATLCELLSSRGYQLSLVMFRQIWSYGEDQPNRTVETKLADYKEAVRTVLKRRSA